MEQHDPSAILAWNKLRGLLNLAAIAAELGIHRSSPSQWRVVPSSRVGALTELLGIPAHRFRPDLYPPPPTDPEGALPSPVAMPWDGR